MKKTLFVEDENIRCDITYQLYVEGGGKNLQIDIDILEVKIIEHGEIVECLVFEEEFEVLPVDLYKLIKTHEGL